MHQPGKVKSKFLTIIFLDEVQRLHVHLEFTLKDHAPSKSPAILKPRLVNKVTVSIMHREMSSDYTTLLEVVNVHFLFKGFGHDCLDLTCIKLIEHITRIALVWHHAVKVRQTALDAEDFTH